MTGSGRIERGSVLCSQTTEWLFNLVGLIFFVLGNADEKSRAQRWSMRSPIQDRGENREKGPVYSRCVIGFETQRRIYIKVITTIRHMEKAYTHVCTYTDGTRGFGYTDSSASLSIFRHRFPRDSLSRRVRAKITTGKLGICPRYADPDIYQVEQPIRDIWLVNLSRAYQGTEEYAAENDRNFGSLWKSTEK